MALQGANSNDNTISGGPASPVLLDPAFFSSAAASAEAVDNRMSTGDNSTARSGASGELDGLFAPPSPPSVAAEAQGQPGNRTVGGGDVYIVQVAVGDSHSLALDSKGRVYFFGFDKVQFQSRPTRVLGPLASKVVVSVSANNALSVAVTADGLVYQMGHCDGTLKEFFSSAKMTLVEGIADRATHLAVAGRFHVLATTEPRRIVLPDALRVLERAPPAGVPGLPAGLPKRPGWNEGGVRVYAVTESDSRVELRVGRVSGVDFPGGARADDEEETRELVITASLFSTSHAGMLSISPPSVRWAAGDVTSSKSFFIDVADDVVFQRHKSALIDLHDSLSQRATRLEVRVDDNGDGGQLAFARSVLS